MNPWFEYNAMQMWWKHGCGTLEADMKSFKDDGDALELVAFVEL